jgi:hypothetical protein
MHETPENTHDRDLSRVVALLADHWSYVRAGRTLKSWVRRLELEPWHVLGYGERLRLIALEKVRGVKPGKDGPEPRLSAHLDARKRRRDRGQFDRRSAPLAPFLAAWGTVPIPKPPGRR